MQTTNRIENCFGMPRKALTLIAKPEKEEIVLIPFIQTKAEHRGSGSNPASLAAHPVFHLCESGMAGARLGRVRSILNRTANYILTIMASGKSYGEKLRRAQDPDFAH